MIFVHLFSVFLCFSMYLQHCMHGFIYFRYWMTRYDSCFCRYSQETLQGTPCFLHMCFPFPSPSTSGASVHFLIWNPDLRIDVTKHLLTNAYAAEVKTRLLDHPSDDAPEDEKYHGMYWEWWNRAHLIYMQYMHN